MCMTCFKGAALCFSIGSSVSMEVMPMGVPVMAFGQTDYRHWAVTIDAREDVGAGFDRAMDTDWPFERFLYRFFRDRC